MSFLKLFNIYHNRLASAKIINKIDDNFFSSMNFQNFNELQNLKDNGHIIIKNFLNEEEIANLVKKYEKKKYTYDESIFSILKKVEQNLYPIISGYLSEDAVLYKSAFHNADKEMGSNTSNNWHTDCLGHKLNVFFILKKEGEVPTCYVNKSHKKPFKPNLIEDLRQIKKGILNIKRKNEEIELKGEVGDAVVFDANGLHRGKYENCINTNFKRLSFTCNFIHKQKVYDLGYFKEQKYLLKKASKLSFRRSDKRIIITEATSKQFKNLKFIDKNLIQENEDGISYIG